MQARAATLAHPVWVLWAAAATAAAPALAVLYLYNPLQVGFYPRCLLYVVTGVYCPGCGALRAMHALLHGRILTALDYNALFVLSLPFLGYAIAAQGLEALAGRPVLPTRRISGRTARGILWLFIVFTVLRNIPVYPLNVLAP
ncbi:MAG TPA: DUF2752 domain-containing protein [Longimicrobiaceae bacterium]